MDEPDFSTVPEPTDFKEWRDTAHGHHDEDIPSDAPPPLGKRVILSHYYDASLMHHVLNGKAVTWILYFYNKTPIDWFCKKQATAETTTYKAEFSACQTCLEQVIDHRNYLWYLSVEVYKYSYIWGDNKSQIQSTIIPHSKLKKRHNILSYHYIRSFLSQQFACLNFIRSENNAADSLTKYWGYNAVYDNILRLILHHAGNTITLMANDTIVVERSISFDDIKKIFTSNGEYHISQRDTS